MDGLSVYKVIYPISAWAIVLVINKNQAYSLYYGITVRKTLLCWGSIGIWGVILSFLSSDVFSSLTEVHYIFCLVYCQLLLVYISRKKTYMELLIGVYCTISLVIAFSGVYEALTGNFYHLTYASYAYKKNGLGLFRPNTIFYNINDNAVFCYFSLVVSFLFTEGNKNMRWLRALMALTFLCNVLFTDSRGALLGSAVFLFCYWIRYTNKKKKLIALFTFSIIIMLVGVWIYEAFISQYMTGLGRDSVWGRSIEKLEESWYFGVGPGNIAILNGQDGSNGVNEVHSFFLEIFCEYGVVGIVSLVFWFIYMIKQSFRMSVLSRKAFICFSSFLGFLPVSISSSSLIGKPWLIAYFAIIIVIMNSIELNTRSNKLKRRGEHT